MSKNIKCPSCKKELDRIWVNDYYGLYIGMNTKRWHWDDIDSHEMDFLCPHCETKLEYSFVEPILLEAN